IYIAWPDAVRLLDFFLRRRATPPPDADPPPFRPAALRVGFRILKWIVVLYLLYLNVVGSYTRYQRFMRTERRPLLYGIYDVDTFERNGAADSPGEDLKRWKKVFIQYGGSVRVVTQDDTNVSFSTQVDAVKHTIRLDDDELNYTRLPDGV